MRKRNYGVRRPILTEPEISKEDMERYIEGLKRFSEKGIPIYVDGRLSRPRQRGGLFRVRGDGMFYLGDYGPAE